MNRRQQQSHKHRFVNAFRAVLSEQGRTDELVEAAFCAYADPNPLIRYLFWRRLWLAIGFLESRGPYRTMLDFGCGGGVTLPLLTNLSRRVVGVDINLAPYRAMSRHISFPDRVEVYDAKEHPLSSFPGGVFDVIIALDVLEHIDDLEDVFSEMCRVTSPGGVIVVSGPTENWFYQIGRWIAGEEYTGNYHVSDIYDVRKTAERFIETKTLATLYFPCTLFELFVGRVAGP